MADVFLSYKREDQAVARGIAKDLEDEGYTVFFDVRIEVGDNWDARIERELDSAHAVVVLWSPRSRESQWVRREAREALSRRILCPAMIARCKVPLEFSDVQAANLVGRRTGDRAHAEWRRLCDGVAKCVRRKPKGVAPPTERETPPVRPSTLSEQRTQRSIRHTSQNAFSKGSNRIIVAVLLIFMAAATITPLYLLLRAFQPENNDAATQPAQHVQEAVQETPAVSEVDIPSSESALSQFREILGTWRCASAPDAFPRFMRFTPLGDRIVYWYTDDAAQWDNTLTEYVYPQANDIWRTGVNGSEWTLRDGHIELVHDNVMVSSVTGCTRLERVS